MDVVAALVSGDEAAEAAEPSVGALDLPTMPAEAVARLDTAAGDAGPDPAPATVLPAAVLVVALVAVQLVGPAARPSGLAAHRRHRIEHGPEFGRVVAVGWGERQAERRAVPVDDEMPLGARLAPVHRARAGAAAPLFARTEQESTEARDQSIRSAPRIRASNSACTRSQAPAACQSRSRRQQVIPEPHPISRGSISQGKPLFSTKRMPVSAARFSTGGRPPFGPGRGGDGRSASITAQRSSGSRARAMLAERQMGCVSSF